VTDCDTMIHEAGRLFYVKYSKKWKKKGLPPMATATLSNLSLLPGRIIAAFTTPSRVAFYSRESVVAAPKGYRQDVESDLRDTASLLDEDPDKAVQTQEIEVPLYTVLVDLCTKFELDEAEIMDIMGINQWSAHRNSLDSVVMPALKAGGRANPSPEQSYPF